MVAGISIQSGKFDNLLASILQAPGEESDEEDNEILAEDFNVDEMMVDDDKADVKAAENGSSGSSDKSLNIHKNFIMFETYKEQIS